MRILTLNTGSSSLKAGVFRIRADGEPPALERSAKLSGIGSNGRLQIGNAARDESREIHVRDHREAVDAVLPPLLEGSDGGPPDALALRVVHGGPDLHAHRRIDEEVRQQLESARERAPLHNGPALEGLARIQHHLGADLPAVAVLDTVFFEALPEVERSLPIPPDIAHRHGLRRHGFHGLAHESLLESYHSTDKAGTNDRVISLQLGSGCSIATFRGRQPLSQSMGFTPVSGPMMATRSGSIDPGVPLFLAKHTEMTPEAVEEWLNTECGLRGVSGVSSKMGAIIKARDEGSGRARLAFDLFVHQIRQHVGSALASIGRPDAVLFGGGIGENAPDVRKAICAPLDWIGLRLDSTRNAAPEDTSRCISSPESEISVHCFEVDEESLLARHGHAALTHHAR